MNVNGENSQERSISHGVSQGSGLGPLIFIVMMNDISFDLDCGVGAMLMTPPCRSKPKFGCS